jgi:hypothetical protein
MGTAEMDTAAMETAVMGTAEMDTAAIEPAVTETV